MSLCKAIRTISFFFGNKKTYWMAAQKSRVFHWKDQHFDFSLQFCYSKMHCFREYLQTTGKSVCLPHLIRLGCEAGAAAAALRGRRSWRTCCRSGCRNRETVRWRSTVLHWRGPTKNWAECEGRDKRERKTCLEINSSGLVSVCYYVMKWLLSSSLKSVMSLPDSPNP